MQPLTPEEFVQEYDLLGPQDRLEVARLVIDAKLKADAAHGAYTFAKQHRCPESIGGYVEGYQDGEKAGRADGYQDGYAYGSDDGFKNGYAQGYDKALQDSRSSVING